MHNISRWSVLCISLLILLSLFVRPHDTAKLAVTTGLLSGTIISAPPPQEQGRRILLIPLDSRPPCTQFVVDLGKIAGLEVLLPPAEMLDHYRQPADREQLFTWLQQNAVAADSAIISLDMLIHGSLLSSRLSNGNEQDIQRALQEIRQLKQESPRLRIHLFHIIPRLLLADIPEFQQFQKPMLNYSLSQDQLITFENQWRIPELLEDKSKIPPEIQRNYQHLYQQNLAINQALIRMTQDGLLETLVVGQDDGQPFGLPNAAKQYMQTFLHHHSALQPRVFVTRGTDEVAISLLGREFVTTGNRRQPKVYAAYASPEMSKLVMPYMPHTVATTVQEKLALAGVRSVGVPEEADVILYLFVGHSGEDMRRLREQAVQDIATWLAQGQKVALVDLSEHFSGRETVLPALLTHKVPLTSLAAYAGWNTTSNSIGTAVTQALLYTGATDALRGDSLAPYYHHLSFLTARFLDDWYYQKDIQPRINDFLMHSKSNPYRLDNRYAEVNQLVARQVHNSALDLTSALYQMPFIVTTEGGAREIRIVALRPQARLPWERTFEIAVTPQPVLLVFPKK